MTEQNNGSTPPAEAQAPAAAVTETPTPAPAPKAPAPKEVPPMPTQVPPEGAEYVQGEDGLWHVRRIRTDEETAAAIAKAVDKRTGGTGEIAPDAAAGQAVAEAVVIPAFFPEQFAHDEDTEHEVKNVAGLLGEVGYTAPQAQRLIDFASEIAMETGIDGSTNHPHLDNREDIEGLLRLRWGSEHDANLKATRAAANKLGPKFKAWLDKGAGNYIPVIEALSALGRGDFGLSKDAATKEAARLRESPAMRQSGHRDHKYVVTRYRLLTAMANRGDDGGAGFEAAVSRMLTGQIKQNVNAAHIDPLIIDEKIVGKTRPSAAAAAATSAGETKIAAIREKLMTAKNGTAEWRSLRLALNQAYAEAYPGDQP